ncbi:hypothetical protein TNCV_59231 [Trichonephila clavipes]|nr:hypothetical protein TNCV_59231 [Trichonephila clavipes]
MPEGAIANAICCWSYFRKAAPESLVAIENKNTDAGLTRKSDTMASAVLADPHVLYSGQIGGVGQPWKSLKMT